MIKTVIARLIAWNAERIVRANVNAFKTGQRYAKEVLTSNQANPVDYLHNIVDGARLYGDYTLFDAGIEDVLQESMR